MIINFILYIYITINICYNLTMDRSSSKPYGMTMIEWLVYSGNLGEFKNSHGAEGVAYFINDELILKKYYNHIDMEDKGGFDEVLKEMFVPYCKSMIDLYNRGLNVPKIVEYQKVADKHGIESYYILQEKIKGRETFNIDLERFCKNVYYDEKYGLDYALKQKDEHLLHDIILSYIDDFILVNEFIESADERVLEKFIMDAYNVYKFSKASVPDVSGRNVLLDTASSKFSHIDLFMTDRNNDSRFSADDSKTRLQIYDNNVIKDIINLFNYNNFETLKREPCFVEAVKSDPAFANEVENYLSSNIKMCSAAIQKMMRVMRRCLNNPRLKDDRLFSIIYNNLTKIFGNDSEKAKIIQMTGYSI